MLDLIEKLPHCKAMIGYFGVCNDNLTDKLIELVNYNKDAQKHQLKINRRIPYLVAECFQNVIRHKVDKKELIGKVSGLEFFQILMYDDLVTISSSNLVKKEDVSTIKSQLESVNHASPEELKKLRENIIKYGELSVKGGAGLGLIEMARKGGIPLRNDFIDCNERLDHFFLSLDMQLAENSPEKKYNIERLKSDFKSYTDNNVILVYSGDFTLETNQLVLQMFNENLGVNERFNGVSSKSIQLFSEILQNATFHGQSAPNENKGTVIVFRKEDGLYLICQNSIPLADTEKFDQLILNPDTSITEMGLAKIVKTEKFDFKFSEKDKPYNRFTLEVKLND
ncbi:MAG: DUF6272 family protein [Crocinitomicaceae bacterium]